jgi:signal transduction histidine kinase
VNKWPFPTFSEIVAQDVQMSGQPGFVAQQRVRAEQEWRAAIAALNLSLSQTLAAGQEVSPTTTASHRRAPAQAWERSQGLVLSGPVPVLAQFDFLAHLTRWVFTAHPLQDRSLLKLRLMASAVDRSPHEEAKAATVALLPDDPIAAEQFCLVMTADLSLVMVLGDDLDGNPAFLFSFNPIIIEQCWQALRARLMFFNAALLPSLDQLARQFGPSQPDYRLVTHFSRLMLLNLPNWQDDGLDDALYGEKSGQWHAAGSTGQTPPPAKPPHAARESAAEFEAELASRAEERSREGRSPSPSFDIELLQAIAHKVRTPLSTIRTLTRLLLKRKDLSPDVLKQLSVIDQECTDQIDRFSLIFRAVELETTDTHHPVSPLAPMSLAQTFQQTTPRWQQLAKQRGLTLDVELPQQLPLVVTDPVMLEQVLTDLIDRITQTLPLNSHIQVQVALAGHQLKLQVHSEAKPQADKSEKRWCNSSVTPLKSLGHLLMFQPETGSLSLSMKVTKTLFQALGGKLIVKQKPNQGEVLTIYLPLESYKPGEQGGA